MNRLIEMKSSLPITKSGKIKINNKFITSPRWQSKVVFQKNQNATYNTMQNALVYFKNIIFLCKEDILLSETVKK